MVFVNTIAEIVHSSVDRYGGAANKNIGDAFLLVWKLIYESKETDSDAQTWKKIKTNHLNQQLAELSLLSFVEIIIESEVRESIAFYNNHPKLNAKINNYSVKMGFGLHVGWAIEGAIGSSYKIDASYLSPNVNMASTLEAATKKYGVMILFTGELYDMFYSQQIKDKCR